jgi:hypothetical protein
LQWRANSSVSVKQVAGAYLVKIMLVRLQRQLATENGSTIGVQIFMKFNAEKFQSNVSTHFQFWLKSHDSVGHFTSKPALISAGI